MGKSSFLWVWASAGTCRPERLWSLHLWRDSNPAGHNPEQPALLELDWTAPALPSRSLSHFSILWFRYITQFCRWMGKWAYERKFRDWCYLKYFCGPCCHWKPDIWWIFSLQVPSESQGVPLYPSCWWETETQRLPFRATEAIRWWTLPAFRRS